MPQISEQNNYQFNSRTSFSIPLGHKGPCPFLVQRSADEHSSTCLYSVAASFQFLFFSHSYTIFAECIDTDCK
jgi:hypothetical protein